MRWEVGTLREAALEVLRTEVESITPKRGKGTRCSASSHYTPGPVGSGGMTIEYDPILVTPSRAVLHEILHRLLDDELPLGDGLREVVIQALEDAWMKRVRWNDFCAWTRAVESRLR